MEVNDALLWAQILVDELHLAGLRRVVLAPGSRSTPLTLAFTDHAHIHCTLHLDERSAAFHALGQALVSRDPVALVCTSGTAAAEFFPAIIEASQSDIPLLVLTADRPPELRNSGANQTIDQVKLYGGYLRWQVDLALPEANPTSRTIRYLKTTAARAYAAAVGLLGSPGPVHLNLPFRKPLEPQDIDQWGATRLAAQKDARPTSTPWTRIHHGLRSPTSAQLDELTDMLSGAQRGIIVAGPRSPAGDFPSALLHLAQIIGYPILADPLSGLRFNLPQPHAVIGGYTLGLASPLSKSLLQPEIILRFGALPTSKPLNKYLEALPAEIPQISVQGDGRWTDGGHMLSHLLSVDETQCCRGLIERLDDFSTSAGWLDSWKNLDTRVQAALQAAPICEGQLTRTILTTLPPETNVMVANSLPIRHVDEFVPTSTKLLQLFGNRGASGIDGTVSTALGIAMASEKPTVLLTGDLSFYHDQNGLFAQKNQDINITIVLFHNDGGGIFQRLPVSHFEPAFKKWFVTPHGLDFTHTAQQYGLAFQRCKPKDIAAVLPSALATPGANLLEIRTDAAQDQTTRQQIISSLQP